MGGILEKTVWELSELLAKREISSEELTLCCLSQIEKQEPEIGAYITVTADRALRSAAETDKKRKTGEPLSILAGIPAAINDNICTKGVLTSCASKMLYNFVPPYDAHVAELLRGCPLLGKLNMDEFAMGFSTENSAVKTTKNPLDKSRVPGGGSAAAVAAREAPFALGSDTGGSVRLPAAFCGVVGIRPTYGSVSRYGLAAFASSLDQIAPLAKDVRDSAIILNQISAHDPRDATSIGSPRADNTSMLGRDASGLKIALVRESFGSAIDKSVKNCVLAAAKRFESMGAKLDYVSMPAFDYALAAYHIISAAEASSNLARFDGVRFGRAAPGCSDIDGFYERTRGEGFGDEVKRRIILGTLALSSGCYDDYYKKALKVRSLIIRDFNRIFENWDLILSPAAPATACKIGEKQKDPVEAYNAEICTVPASLAGIPALSMPCGTDENALPVGMQLIGRAFSEPLIYRAAYAFERQKGGN